MGYAERLAVIDEIRVAPEASGNGRIRSTVTVRTGDIEKSFSLIYSYSEPVTVNENIAGLMSALPVINFTLFAKKLVLDFPVSDQDMEYLRELVRINNTEVFVNKLLRRRYEFFRKEYLPKEEDISPQNARGVTEIVRSRTFMEPGKVSREGSDEVAVLSSGGKESLLTYGMLRETGARTHAFYFNESGSHWFTASTAYAYYKSCYRDVHKVWSNVDRLYRFFLRNLPQIDQAAIRRKTDTYPVQLFIFPVYVMAFVPLARKLGIGSMVLGDEFDDPREMSDYRGIHHYYGVFDQTHDFNRLMSAYLSSKGMDFEVWSAVYAISGSVVEKILINRYPELFRLQRSCHSCRSREGGMVPCGKCSKCLGIMMFTLAAGGNPKTILYGDESLEKLEQMVSSERMRLDSDELNLMKEKLGFTSTSVEDLQHVDGIHLLPGEETPFEKIPEAFREKLSSMMSSYASGTYELIGSQWIKV